MKIKFGLVLLSLLLPTTLVTAQLPAANQSPVLKNPTILQKIRGQYKNHVESGALALNDSMNSAALNCDGNQNILQAQASAPCNGVSVTSVAFNNASRTVESGTDKKVGVVYRYANAGTAPDGTVLDALVTVQSYSNNQDADQTTFSDADVPAATAGYDQNLQPNINQESGTLNGATSWTGAITYRIQFVVTGTSTPKRISIAATTIDNDGGGVCGGANNLRESVTLSPAPQQFLLSTTPATTQTIIGNTVQGPGTNQANIGIGPEYAAAGLYLNITEMNWTYSFTTGNTCTSANGTASANRFGSLNMSCQIDFPPGFVSFPLSGKVYNDVNGLTDSTVNGTGTGTPSGTQLYANLVDGNGFVVSSVAVNADGTYSFPTVVNGTYTVRISTTQGVESNAAPAIALPAGWVSTGENLGVAAGNDGAANGSLSVTVNGATVTNANFGIEQRPTANNNTSATLLNPGGTNSTAVPATTFSGTDPVTNTVSSIRITAFPSNATSITINGTQYTSATFPAGGVTVPTNAAGNPTQPILVDPSFAGSGSIVIPYVAIDNAGVESSSPANATLPVSLNPTASKAAVSGKLLSGDKPLGDTLVTLTDLGTNTKKVVRTNAAGDYSFTADSGKSYIVQPLSGKYAFDQSSRFINLTKDAAGLDFNSTAKSYHPKNDFDGDGKTDIVVYRASEGNWYVQQSSDDKFVVFHWGLPTDIPVSADFDGDGKTDFAVFRPSEGNWYIWQSKSQQMRVERFGLSSDKVLPADFDGDGKADVAVYRDGLWYVHQSSDDVVRVESFGFSTDLPLVGDYDGDGKADISVYRPEDGNWYTRRSSDYGYAVHSWGLATDVPVVGDFDGDGRADFGQFRNGDWYQLNTTTDYELNRLGKSGDQTFIGDFDGDGRADTAVYRDGVWTIRMAKDGSVKTVWFGLPTDQLVK